MPFNSEQNIPRPSAGQEVGTRALTQRIGETAAAVESLSRHVGRQQGPAFDWPQDGFWAKIEGSAAGQHSWTEQQRVDDGWEDMPSGRTGTTSFNFALSTDGSDVAAETVVWMKEETDTGGGAAYSFTVGGGGGNAVVVYLASRDGTSGGQYRGKMLTGTCTADSSGNLTMPEGMTVPSSEDCIVLNMAENGTSRQDLPVNTAASYHNGIIVPGTHSENLPYVVINAVRRIMFPVTVTVDGGSVGDYDNTCSLTYTAKDLKGTTLGTTLTPSVTRTPTCPYSQPAANSPGIGYYNSSNNFVLYDAAQERPAGEQTQIVTTVGWNATTHRLEFTTQLVRVLAKKATTVQEIQFYSC